MQKDNTLFQALIDAEAHCQAREAHAPFYMETELTQRIASADEAGAIAILRAINARPHATLAGDPLRSMRNSMICSCTFFARAAILGGAGTDDVFSLSDILIRVIERLDDTDTLIRFEEEMARRFVIITREQNQKRYSGAVRQAIGYVNLNFLKPMTVNSIAAGIFVHPSYLSSRFKRETGATLTHYIHARRVQEAQIMLRKEHETVAAIAEACQFCSQSHFIQVFKKHTGMTPEQFRRMEGLK